MSSYLVFEVAALHLTHPGHQLPTVRNGTQPPQWSVAPARQSAGQAPGQVFSEAHHGRASADRALAALQAAWPDWGNLWVPLALGSMTWCARRHDNHRRVLNAHSPAELEECLQAEAAD